MLVGADGRRRGGSSGEHREGIVNARCELLGIYETFVCRKSNPHFPHVAYYSYYQALQRQHSYM